MINEMIANNLFNEIIEENPRLLKWKKENKKTKLETMYVTQCSCKQQVAVEPTWPQKVSIILSVTSQPHQSEWLAIIFARCVICNPKNRTTGYPHNQGWVANVLHCMAPQRSELQGVFTFCILPFFSSDQDTAERQRILFIYLLLFTLPHLHYHAHHDVNPSIFFYSIPHRQRQR